MLGLISFGAVLISACLAVAWVYYISLPLLLRLPEAKETTLEGVRTIPDAIVRLKMSRKIGWELVAEAQNLVARKMGNSRRNNWDSPARAFLRGLGNSQQKALALEAILKGLGFACEPMAATCRLPKGRVDGECENERAAFHVWLSVNIDRVAKDVCVYEVGNRPGANNFGMLSPRRGYARLSQAINYAGIVFANVNEDNAAVARAALREAVGMPQRLFDHASAKAAAAAPPPVVRAEPKPGRPQMASRAWMSGGA